MKFRIFLLMLTLSIGLSAVGLSIGPEFGFDFGTSDIDVYNNNRSSDDFGSTQWRLNIMVDTGVCKYVRVNYRCRVGYGQIHRTYDSLDWDLLYDVFSTEHSVGIGLIRKKNMRLWLGPSIQLEMMSMEDSETDDQDYENLNESSVFGVGLGPTVGFNLRTSEEFAVGMELGFKYKFEIGDITLADDHMDIMSNCYMITFKAFPILLEGEYW